MSSLSTYTKSFKKKLIKSSIQTIKVKTGSNLNYCGGFVFVMEGTRSNLNTLVFMKYS
jgi:hypothetical protein